MSHLILRLNCILLHVLLLCYCVFFSSFQCLYVFILCYQECVPEVVALPLVSYPVGGLARLYPAARSITSVSR